MIPELLYEIYQYLDREDYLKIKIRDVEGTELKYLVKAFRDLYEAKLLYCLDNMGTDKPKDKLKEFVWVGNKPICTEALYLCRETVIISTSIGTHPTPTLLYNKAIDMCLLAGVGYIVRTNPQWKVRNNSLGPRGQPTQDGFRYKHPHWKISTPINDNKLYSISDLFISLAKNGQLALIKQLLANDNVIWHDTAPFALEAASEGGYLDVVEYLFINLINQEHAYFTTCIHKTMELAIYYDHIDIIKYLLRNVDERYIMNMDIGYIQWMQIKLMKSNLLNYKN